MTFSQKTRTARVGVILAIALTMGLVGCGEELPKAADVSIIPVSAAGSGCPNKDNSRVSVKPFSAGNDVSGVRIQYENLLVEKNPNTTSKDSRKFCEVKFKIRTDGPWQFRIERSMWLGSLRLYPEHRLDINYTQRIGTGAPVDAKLTHGNGTKKSANIRLMTNELKEVWSKCADAPLVSVKSALKITGDLSKSDNVFDLTPPGSQTLLLRWRKCG